MTLKDKVSEVLKRNNIRYNIRDYYELEEKNSKMKGLTNQYGITYFIKLNTSRFGLKLRVYKESELIYAHYDDYGGNNYFTFRCKIEEFEEKIKTSMYLIDAHLRTIKDMSLFANGKTPLNIIRGQKIDDISKEINNI